MMINWKLRLQNKATLFAIIGAIVACVYQILGVIGIAPTISESEIVNIVGVILNLLVALGVIIDPTTPGIGDSTLARNREHINEAEVPD